MLSDYNTRNACRITRVQTCPLRKNDVLIWDLGHTYIELVRVPHRGDTREQFFLYSHYVIANISMIKIHRTIILPVLLYGCETWSLTEGGK